MFCIAGPDMKLSLQTDFALRVLIYAAVRDERINVSDVADFFDISKAHVAKVVNLLSRHGYVRSIRGVGGGVELAKPPEDITVGEIINCVEGQAHMLDCMSMSNVCVIEQFCNLKSVLFEAEQIQNDYLTTKTIADVLPGVRQMKSLINIQST